MKDADGPLTIAAIAEKTRIPLRTVKFWGDQAILVPTAETFGAGRGVHRVYPKSQLYLAGILGSLAAARVPLGPMREIASFLRGPLLLIAGEPGDPVPIALRRSLERAIAGEGQNILVIYVKDGHPHPHFQVFSGRDDLKIPVAELLSMPFVPVGEGGRNVLCAAIDLNAALSGLEP